MKFCCVDFTHALNISIFPILVHDFEKKMGIDNSWAIKKADFKWQSQEGSLRPITFCPFCGIKLDAFLVKSLEDDVDEKLLKKYRKSHEKK